jgi:hypothetical protein
MKSMTAEKYVVRVLRKFEKNGDDLVAEFELEGIKLKALQRLFHRPSNDPMYLCYPVSKHHAKYLQKYVSEKIDVESYDYFVESDAVSEMEIPEN